MQRQSNIEILRIIATMMVIMVHTAFLSLGVPQKFDSSGLAISAIQIFSVPAVDIFILISGYFHIKPKVKGLGNYLFQVLFYSIFIYVLWLVLGRCRLNVQDIKECFFLTEANWFIKSYLLLFIVSPIINTFVDNCSRRTHCIIILSMLAYQTVFDFATMADLSIRSGYSTMSFVLLYLIGSYIKKYPNTTCICIGGDKMKIAITGLIFYGLLLLPVIASYFDVLNSKFVCKYLQHGLAYSNPLIIGVAVCYLRLFLKVCITSRVVNWIAISSFSAFLIHANPNVIRLFIRYVSNLYASNSLACYIAFVIVFVVCVFMASVFIDKIRMFLWNLLWNNIEKRYVRK